jgi:hypothetical protein
MMYISTGALYIIHIEVKNMKCTSLKFLLLEIIFNRSLVR